MEAEGYHQTIGSKLKALVVGPLTLAALAILAMLSLAATGVWIGISILLPFYSLKLGLIHFLSPILLSWFPLRLISPLLAKQSLVSEAYWAFLTFAGTAAITTSAMWAIGDYLQL